MKTRHFLMSLVALALALPFSQPSFAQGVELEEIVVTARKRSESLLEIPITISAFSAEQIERAGYTTIRDLVTAVPGVQYESYEAEGRGDSPSFRGVSTNTGDPTLQNSSKFIDGVYVSGSLYTVMLDNIERVEVTKGPQSALFGRASFSGAINYITKKPTNDFEGNLRLSIAEENEYQVSGSVSGPLAEDRVLFRVSAATFSQGSPYTNITNGAKMGQQDIDSVSATLRVTPSEQFTGDLMVSYTDAQFGEAARATTALNMGELAFPDVTIIGGGTQQLDNPGVASETLRVSLNMNYEMANGYELSVIAGMGQEDTVNEADGDYAPAVNLAFLWFLCVGPYAGPGCELFQTVTEREIESSFAEVRIASPDDGPLRWLAGVAWFDEDFNTARIRNFRQPPSFKTSTTASAFGSVSYDVSDSLTLSLDGRFQGEEIELQVPEANRSQSDEFDSFLPRVLAEYQLSDDTLLYFSAAKGNKPGNFNASAPPDLLIVDEEEMWNYEFGAKLSAMEGRLNFQAAGYFIDWTNQVYRFNDPDPNYGSYFINAGETDVMGADFSVAAILSECWSASLGYSWIDTEFQVFESNNAITVLGDADVSGNETARTANNSLFASVQYTSPFSGFGGDSQVFAGLDVSYRSEMFIDELNLETIEPRTLVNVRGGIDTGTIRLTAFVNNLFDNDSLTTGFRFGAVALVGLPMPRQAGVSVSLDF
ncbi:MAG: TonB-dependent receptor [Gammaproteobacteria bacterium]|nr:TonB-dependent receptor [Gammaproteobacteria bacterium]